MGTGTMSSSDFNRGKELVQIAGIFIRETEKADLIDFPNKVEPSWLPKSQYGRKLDIQDVSSGDCKVVIPRWLAEKNGLDYEEFDPVEEGEVEGEDLPEDEWADEDAYNKMFEKTDGREESS